MSSFLGFESFLIPLGASIQDVQDIFESALTSYGWQVQRRAKPPLAILGTIPNPANAFDMVDSTYAGYYVVACTLGIQMAAAFTPTAMFILGENSAATGAPSTFTLDYSDDGISWTTLQTWNNEINWTNWEQREYAVTGAVAHTYWRLNITANNGATGTYIADWALEDAASNRITTNPFLDLIPPATETIGNADAMEVLRLEFGSNTLRFRGLQYARAAQPQVIGLWQKTAGAVACALTINGVTISGAMGNVSSTAQQNLRSLYEAIRASADPTFLDWNWEYQKPSPQGAGDPNDYIYGVRKTLASNIVITPNLNVNAATLGSYSAAFPQGVNATNPANCTLTTDLVNGFIYYLQVNARGIGLATKTNSAFFGPIHACYGDHAKALSALPNSGWSLRCTPIELMIGWDDVAANAGSTARTTHYWAVTEATGQTTQNIVSTYGSAGTAFGKLVTKSKILDLSLAPGAYGEFTAGLWGSNLFSGGDAIGNDFQVHRVSTTGESLSSSSWVVSASSSNVRLAVPCLDLQDWYKFVGTATDEALLLVADTVAITSLTANVGVGDVTVNVSSTAGFQSAGFVVIESEIVQYTGITASAFTGCTRGKYGSQAAAHFAGDAVGQGLWFTKINGGALFCGYVKPS